MSFCCDFVAVTRGCQFQPGWDVVSGRDARTARLWNTADGTPIRTFTGGPYHVYAAEFSPDGKWPLIAGKDRPVLGEVGAHAFPPHDASAICARIGYQPCEAAMYAVGR